MYSIISGIGLLLLLCLHRFAVMSDLIVLPDQLIGLRNADVYGWLVIAIITATIASTVLIKVTGTGEKFAAFFMLVTIATLLYVTDLVFLIFGAR